MAIIKSIEIRYFRSIYRIKLKNLQQLNILSGCNDAGKSNVLKAINLFFNGQTDWQTPMEFYRDFSTQRLVQVRKESIKGKQFICIEIEFYRPERYKGSLPEVFQVSRTWHRDSRAYTEANNLEYLNKHNKLPSSLESAKRSLQIFLNRVHFEYVPAVKDREYFRHILARLQKALLDVQIGTDTTISQTVDNLAQHIESKIIRLQQDFERATNIHSAVMPPPELASLFQAFYVSTDVGEEHKIPLAFRGDGIQALYVPSVLRYICENSKDFFIWGFEEPENSLEYSHVINLARDLQDIYSNLAQIFITTHSPALTSLRNERCLCFRVSRNLEGISDARLIWPEKGSSEERSKLNVEMGFMKIQENLHTEYVAQSEQLRLLQDEMARIEEEARQAKKPLLLTEGKHDKSILETAWTKCRSDASCPFVIVEADTSGGLKGGGTGGASNLAKVLESVIPSVYKKPVIGMFDRDEEGLKCFKSLSKNFTHWQNRDDVRMHKNELAFAVLLPIPSGREKHADFKNLTIEFLFPDAALETHTSDGRGLILEEPVPTVRVKNIEVPVDTTQLTLPLGILDSLHSLRKVVSGKSVFAEEIVPTLDSAHFHAFELLFELLEKIVSPSNLK